MAENLITSRSVYSKRERHQTLNNGSTIYENDYTTIYSPIPLYGDDNGYKEGNFKIVFNTDPNSQKKYGVGDWVKPTIGNDDDFWTLNEIVNDEVVDVETNVNTFNDTVILKPDYSLLSNFAYYGSTEELIRSSVENIVINWPASLWVRPSGSNVIYELVNDFDIDLFTEPNIIPNTDFKVFFNNLNNYEIVRTEYKEEILPCGSIKYKQNKLTNCKYIIDSDNTEQTFKYIYVRNQSYPCTNGYCDDIYVLNEDENEDKNYGGILINDPAFYNPIKLLDNIVISSTDKTESDTNCPVNNIKITLDYVYNEDEPCTLLRIETHIEEDGTPLEPDVTNSSPYAPSVSYHIKPINDYVNKFFQSLNDFQKLLLNRYTNPIYSSNFKIPEMTDFGTFYVDNKFTWAIPDGWNIDIVSNDYLAFIDKLVNAAISLDASKSDNIYRMLTHESIKNMDWSFERMEDNDKAQLYYEAGTKVKNLLRIYGREYDEIKKYIHTIEIINNLTYDEKDNYPDVLLKTNLNYEGWVGSSLVTPNNIKDKTNNLYYGYKDGFTAKELESEFYRRLLLNSNYIVRGKGTKNSVELLMNLFGIDRDKWSINEYVYVVNGTYFNDSDKERVELFNEDELSKIAELNKTVPYTLNGTIYYEGDLSGEREPEYDPIDDLHDLCVERYYYGEYYRCDYLDCGGKGIATIDGIKQICPKCHGTGVLRRYYGVPAFKGNTENLYYQQNGGWYQETYRSLKMVNTINDLYLLDKSVLSIGDIYYVNIITDEYDTNYFVLVNIDLFNVIEGWHNLENETDKYIFTYLDKEYTIDLQSILNTEDIVEGNNPHGGQYDDGLSYLQHFGYSSSPSDKFYNQGLFKYTLDNAPRCICDEDQYTKLEGIGFSITEVLDTKKCWGTKNKLNELDGLDKLNIKNDYSILTTKRPSYPNPPSSCNSQDSGWKTGGWFFTDSINKTNIRKINYTSNNLEWYKVINTKKVELTFKGNTNEINEFNTKILPYIEQLIPSSAIFSIKTEEVL